MKKLFTLFLLLISTTLVAQSNLEEVVYLKNGSIIRGVIIEQIPNETLKIRTRDGNVFVYRFDEIEKITKEEPINPQYNNYQVSDALSPDIIKHKKGGITATVLGATFFSVGMPFMLQGIRGYNTFFGNDEVILGRLIPGAILTGTGFPLLIAGPAKLGKYGRLKREQEQQTSFMISPSIQTVDNTTLPAMRFSSPYAIGASVVVNF